MPASSWKSFNNFCVDKNGKDLPQTAWAAGGASQAKCQSECMKQAKCSAYEWYQSGWGGSKCHLMLGTTRSSKGHTGARWQDAMCFVKPAQKICPREGGFCVTVRFCERQQARLHVLTLRLSRTRSLAQSNGGDQNNGVIKLDSVDGKTDAAKQACLQKCLKYTSSSGKKVTGCEVIWDQGNRGCYGEFVAGPVLCYRVPCVMDR